MFQNLVTMRIIPFTKMSGSGNDFILVDNREGLLHEGEAAKLAQVACPQHISVGADGIILIEKALVSGHDYRMRIFNADGSEAEMCGNGSRCIAVFACQINVAKEKQRIETIAGSLAAVVATDGLSAKVQLSPPSRMELKKDVNVLGQKYDLYFINTGVPHAVLFVPDVTKVDTRKMGACIRYHEIFKPKGSNVNFAQLLGNDTLRIRTYERGVEDETFACGTGATATAIIASLVHGYRSPVKVLTQSQAILTIYFEQQNDDVSAPFLEGAVDTIYKGEFYWRE
ncbi:MAG: diaminopimelate epimerase [Planctomycetota bacterium]